MMYGLIRLIIILAMGLLTVPCATEAQPARKVFQIGFLFPGTSAFAAVRLEPFRQRLRELGYIEGQHYVLESRAAEGQPDRLPALAADLIRLPVDVVVVAATGAAKAAKNATGTTPIVMVDPGDPVSAGLVASLAQPGGNMTGLSSVTPDLVAKNLQLLKDAVPELPRVAFLWNVATSTGAQAFQEMQKATQRLGIQLHSVEVRGTDDFETAFAAMRRAQPMALLVFPDPLTFSHRGAIVDFAAKQGLPAMFGAREFVESGGLMAYGPSFPDMFRRAATYVDKILKGTKPADLPVEQPMKFELIINLKTAKALGLTIPPTLLFQADEVIQ
jgi:putative tryptophan/tyrosine transport system substrate-binding protein